jgi:hypothetical protein
MKDPCHSNYPRSLLSSVGLRNMIRSWATTIDGQTVQSRWGKVGRQKLEDAGTLCPERMKTIDDKIFGYSLTFVGKSKER